MSSRALRKAQREREEQERLAKLTQEAEELEEEDDAPVAAKKSAFDLLNEQEEEDEDEGGAPVEDDEDEAGLTAPVAATPKMSSKKKKKKKKAKVSTDGAATPAEPEEELDEIDKALKALSTSTNGASAGTTIAGIDAKIDESNRLLSIDTQHLHAQNEMRRLFGRAALDDGDDDEAPQHQQQVGGNRRQQRRVQQAGLAQALRGQGGAGGRSGGLAAMALRRNIFIQGKEEWPIATGGGLGMEVEEKKADGTVIYRFVHNRGYQDVQSQFESCVESMDPQRLILLLRHNPYHISTLLQVSEIAKQDRDHATSGDLLERALFSFGRAVHSTFAKTLAEGKARLDFRRPENREFWLAAWRYMQNLSMRATWRTVYEWAKLLLSLSPEGDEYGIWMVLDQYALRSRQDLDFLNVSRNASMKAVHGDAVNIVFSQALAEFRAGNKSKGRQALYTAAGRCPWVVFRLMQELSIDPPPAIWGKEPRTEREKLHTELYATRAKDLWNTPEASSLLTEVASAIIEGTPMADTDASDITLAEARHVLLSDTPALIALLPRSFTARMTSASDPLPPDDNITSYTTSRQPADGGPGAGLGVTSLGSAADSLRELQGLHGWFAQLFPWFRPGGGAEGPDENAPRPTEEEIERRIQESGVSEETIVERTQRMMLLQQRLMGEVGDGPVEGAGDEDLAAFGPGLQQRAGPEEEEEVDIPRRQPRVEDAPDADD